MRMTAVRIIFPLVACVSSATATTVEPMPVARLADHAAVVCDAVVESVQSRWSEDPREIVSDVHFASVSYWKGSPSPTAAVPATMSLTAPGGTIGTMTMRIAGAPEFAAGQRWVLFVLPEYRVFPVVGLWEGAFRVEPDAQGVDRVLDAGGRAVTGIDAAGFIRTSRVESATAAAHQGCVHAEGLHLTTPAAAASAETAISLAEFKAMLAPTLAASRAHPGGTLVGQRVPTRLTSVPLIRAPAAARNTAESGSIRTLPTAHEAAEPATLRALPLPPEAAPGTIGSRKHRPTRRPDK